MKFRNYILPAAGLLLLAGGLLMFIAFAAGGFRLEGFSKNGPWEEETFTVPAGEVSALYLSTQDFDVALSPYDGSDIEIRYYVNEALGYDQSFADGLLSLAMQPRDSNSWLWWLDMNFDFHDHIVQVRIPRDHVLAAELWSSNAGVSVNSLGFTQLFVKTSNGPVTLERVSCSGEVSLKSSNGALALSGVTATRLNLKTSNGSIRFDGIAFEQAELITSNNSITGSLPDPEAAYSLTADTSNGRIDAGSLWHTGPQRLRLKTSNGSIRVSFGPAAE